MKSQIEIMTELKILDGKIQNITDGMIANLAPMDIDGIIKFVLINQAKAILKWVIEDENEN